MGSNRFKVDMPRYVELYRQGRLKLDEAYALAERHAPRLVLGGIAIAERHHRTCDEHQRMIAKMEKGCRFLVTQAVYDVTSTKSLLSDYALALTGRPAGVTGPPARHDGSPVAVCSIRVWLARAPHPPEGLGRDQ